MAESSWPPGGGGGGTGDITGPVSSTDQGIARWNGVTGEQLDTSNVLIDDNDNVSGINDLEVDGDVVINGNLQVLGTETIVNTDNLNVKDIQITVNSGGNDASATGAGLAVEGTGASTLAIIAFAAAMASKWALGAPGDTSEILTRDHAQEIENKAIGISNDIDVNKDSFRISDDVDPTKQATFDASLISAASVRVIEIPDSDGTMMLLTLAQTVENKTFNPSNVFNVQDDSFHVRSAVDGTSRFRFDAEFVSPGTERVYIAPDDDGELLLDVGSQIVSDKTLDGSNVIKGSDINFSLQNNVDPTKQAMFNTSNISTATTRVITIPDANGTLLLAGATQTISQKTIDNSNIASFRDGNFTLQDDSDTTRQAQFDVSGISTATTRQITIPNASGTILLASMVQSVQNKIIDLTNTVALTEDKFVIYNENDATKFFSFTCETFPTATAVILTIPPVSGTLALLDATQTFQNKNYKQAIIENFADFIEESTSPSTPPAGKVRLFAKNDKKLYKKDSTGLEVEVGGDLVAVEVAANVNPAVTGMLYQYDLTSGPYTLNLPGGTFACVVGYHDSKGLGSDSKYLRLNPGGSNSLDNYANGDTVDMNYANFSGAVYRANGSTVWRRIKQLTSTVVGGQVPGVPAGSSIQPGAAGYRLQAVVSSPTNTSAADTEIDVAGLSLALTEGTWKIGYDLCAILNWVSGTPNAFLRTRISNSSNVGLANTDALVGITMSSTLPVAIFSASRNVEVTVPAGSTVTYKVRVTANAASSAIVGTIAAAGATGSLTDPDNASVFWAERK